MDRLDLQALQDNQGLQDKMDSQDWPVDPVPQDPQGKEVRHFIPDSHFALTLQFLEEPWTITLCTFWQVWTVSQANQEIQAETAVRVLRDNQEVPASPALLEQQVLQVYQAHRVSQETMASQVVQAPWGRPVPRDNQAVKGCRASQVHPEVLVLQVSSSHFSFAVSQCGH